MQQVESACGMRENNKYVLTATDDLELTLIWKAFNPFLKEPLLDYAGLAQM